MVWRLNNYVHVNFVDPRVLMCLSDFFLYWIVYFKIYVYCSGITSTSMWALWLSLLLSLFWFFSARGWAVFPGRAAPCLPWRPQLSFRWLYKERRDVFGFDFAPYTLKVTAFRWIGQTKELHLSALEQQWTKSNNRNIRFESIHLPFDSSFSLSIHLSVLDFGLHTWEENLFMEAVEHVNSLDKIHNTNISVRAHTHAQDL